MRRPFPENGLRIAPCAEPDAIRVLVPAAATGKRIWELIEPPITVADLGAGLDAHHHHFIGDLRL